MVWDLQKKNKFNKIYDNRKCLRQHTVKNRKNDIIAGFPALKHDYESRREAVVQNQKKKHNSLRSVVRW